MSYAATPDRNRAILGGTLIALFGLVLLAATGANDVRTFALGTVLSVGGVLRLMAALARSDRSRWGQADPDDPRWKGGSGLVQVAGRACAECERKITVDSEADSCTMCGVPTHTNCRRRHRNRAHRAAAVHFPG
ncbi:MAG TPA: hypothetical protein VM580_30100 [Labilithrix sp.]|jgi:hypothetical protein|nr:hypothetical protein [Labilithrix sp.]